MSDTQNTNTAESNMANTNTQIANTILEQLGGTGRLVAMTGAKHFMVDGPGVSFKFPNRAAGRPNHCKITLDGSDTYTVTFGRIVKFELRAPSTVEGIYADQLKGLFENAPRPVSEPVTTNRPRAAGGTESTMKKAIVQISTAILGIGDNYNEAMRDAQLGTPELTDSDIIAMSCAAVAGECVCVDITDELAEDAATDNWDLEMNESGAMVAVSTR